MIKFLCFAVFGGVLSVVSGRGYIWLAWSSMIPDAKYAAAALYGALTVGLFWRASRSYGLAALLALAVATSLASVVAFQVFDFWRSGIVLKGTIPFTWKHLFYTVSVTLPGIGAWYSLVAVAAHVARRVARGGRPATAGLARSEP
jgi:hypothetical protein